MLALTWSRWRKSELFRGTRTTCVRHPPKIAHWLKYTELVAKYQHVSSGLPTIMLSNDESTLETGSQRAATLPRGLATGRQRFRAHYSCQWVWFSHTTYGAGRYKCCHPQRSEATGATPVSDSRALQLANGGDASPSAGFLNCCSLWSRLSRNLSVIWGHLGRREH
jgi:hypothetical protein